MNITKFVIPGELPGLNEYIHAINKNRIAGSVMKSNNTDLVYFLLKKQKIQKVMCSVFVEFHWFAKNKRKDPDNISSYGRKVIFDALYKAGIIEQDTWNIIKGFSDTFSIDSENPRIEVTIKSIT